MLTSFGARTITVRTSRPASARLAPGAASASPRSSSSPIPGGPSRRSRTLPPTWTTHVTRSWTSSAGSAVGQPAVATDGWWPSSSQHSSAVYGANSDSKTIRVSAASRTAGSGAPPPERRLARGLWPPPALGDHLALVAQPGERLVKVDHAPVVQDLDEEPAA